MGCRSLTCVRRHASVLSSETFKHMVLGFIGRTRTSSGHDITGTAWEPRQRFFSVVAEPNKATLLNLLEFAAELYYRTDEIQVADMELLMRLVSFLEEYGGVEKETTVDVRLQIDARLHAKANGRRWATYHQILRGHERAWFLQKLRPLFQAKGYRAVDAEDVMEVEWTEFFVQRDRACRRCAQGAGMVGYPPWPGGLAKDELRFGHVVADAIEAGEAIEWAVLEEMEPSVFCNKLSKEDYVRIAVKELLDRAAERAGRATVVPCAMELTLAERDDARKLRADSRGGATAVERI